MIELSNIRVCFSKKAQPVLDHVNFSLNKGDKILLIGASGSGKSVFLNTVMGLTPEKFVQGEFIIDEKPYSYRHYRNHPIHRQISTIFQDAVNSLHPYRKIGKQCTVNGYRPSSKDFEAFRLQYDDIKNEFACRLSGGQCQRISLMFPYLLKRDVIFFDEPITDIDQISRKIILEVIKQQFLDKPEKTIIYITHSYQELSDIKHFKCYQMRDGHLNQAEVFDEKQ